MFDVYKNKLEKLKSQNLYRTLVNSDFTSSNKIKRNSKKLICFSSNDYFSLSQNKAVKKAAIAAIKKFGVSQASSRYISGNNSLYEKLEKQIAKIKKCESAIVFSSGYQTAIGVIPALVGEGDVIFADKLIHSSLIDAAKLSGAKLIRFAHNDILHLEQLLEENREKFKNSLIISEDVFSMNGDKGKIFELKNLAKKFNSLLLTDAAHSLFDEEKVSEDFHIKMGTLSKAVGSFGGYVCGNTEIIDYLRNFSKSAIYTTALPASVLAASLKSLELIEKKNFAKKTIENTKYFCDLLSLSKPESAIVIITIGDNKKVTEIAKKIEEKGFLIASIRPPTVEPNKACLRITFSANHTKKEINKLAKELKQML